MGIKDYLKHLDHEEPNVSKREYDYVYIDCNYMLHYLIYKCRNDQELYSRTFEYFKYVFDTIKVFKKIYLVFDGKYDKKLLTNPKQQTQELRYKNKKESDDYDKQSIYPGSQIVSTYKTYLQDIIEKYKKILMGKFTIETHDDSVEGEADFKILDLIYGSDQDNICILSKDSDMILISYSLIINQNINIQIMSNFRPIKFIDVNKLGKLPKVIKGEKKDIETFGPDYILITLFLGNDYLPKISNITYDSIIKCYIRYLEHGNSKIIKKKKLNYLNLINFITYIVIDKKIKFNFKNLDTKRFSTYYNNLCWTLKQYKILDNDLYYLQDLNIESALEDTNLSDSDFKNKFVKCSEPSTDELSEELDILNGKTNSTNSKIEIENIKVNKSTKNKISINKKIELESEKKEDSDNKIRIRNVINIYNFINYHY
jgi:hypothetical protein